MHMYLSEVERLKPLRSICQCCRYKLKKIHMSHNVWKRNVGHVRPVTIQISLCESAGWSESSLCAFWDSHWCKGHSYRQRRLIRLFWCIGWFKNLLGARQKVRFLMLRLILMWECHVVILSANCSGSNRWQVFMIRSGRAMRKCAFGHMRTKMAEVSLRICTVWSALSLNIIGYYIMYEGRREAWAGGSESAHFWYGPYNISYNENCNEQQTVQCICEQWRPRTDSLSSHTIIESRYEKIDLWRLCPREDEIILRV